jgi:hypothetical protein
VHRGEVDPGLLRELAEMVEAEGASLSLAIGDELTGRWRNRRRPRRHPAASALIARVEGASPSATRPPSGAGSYT